MKKLFALLLALLLALSCMPALAQETAAQTYVYPLIGYSMRVPEGWLVMDYTNIDAYVAAFQNGEMTFPGTNALTLMQISPQIKQTSGAVMINQYGHNIMITSTDLGMTITREQFVELMLPMLKNRLLASVTDGVISSGEVLTLGDHEFISLTLDYTLSGVAVTADQLYLLKDNYMHLFNLTVTNVNGEEAMNAFYFDVVTVLESLTMPE